MGEIMKRRPVSEVYEQIKPWMFIGFAIMVVTGIFLFWCQAVKAYNSIFFQTKVILLVVAAINAIAFERGIYRKMSEWDNALVPPMEARVAGWAFADPVGCHHHLRPHHGVHFLGNPVETFLSMPAIIPFFQWCDDTMVSQAIRNSRIAFPVIENFHLFALTVLLGSLVVLVLRQFGLVYKTQPISEVASALRPWNRWSHRGDAHFRHSALFVGSHEVLRQHFLSGENVLPLLRPAVPVHHLQSRGEERRRIRPRGRKNRRRHCAVLVVRCRPGRPRHRLPGLESSGMLETKMNREVALKIVLAVVGLLFLLLAYPLIVFFRQEPSLSMMFSLYVTLGVFLLLAIRNPLANRSLIAFTAWSSFAHAAVMGTQAMRDMISRGELAGVAVLVVIGAALIALAPAKLRTVPAASPIPLISHTPG